MYMDVHNPTTPQYECMWVCMSVLWFIRVYIWVYSDVHGCIWMFMGVFGCIWVYLDVYGWACRNLTPVVTRVWRGWCTLGIEKCSSSTGFTIIIQIMVIQLEIWIAIRNIDNRSGYLVALCEVGGHPWKWCCAILLTNLTKVDHWWWWCWLHWTFGGACVGWNEIPLQRSGNDVAARATT